MESLNVTRNYGYGKLNLTENIQDPASENHRRRRLFGRPITFIVVLTLVILSLIGALAYHSSSESEDSDPAKSLRIVCAVTRYPKSCFSAISPLQNPRPETPLSFFNLSLQASIVQVSSLKNLSFAVIEEEHAMSDCVALFDDAQSFMEKSADLIGVVGGEKLRLETKIDDLKTWLSAALTNQETCVDGLVEQKSTALDEFKTRVQISEEYLSNTLAILTNIQILFHKFGLTMP